MGPLGGSAAFTGDLGSNAIGERNKADETQIRSKKRLRRRLAKPESTRLYVADGGCRGVAWSQVFLCLIPKQKPHRLPGDSSLVEVGPWSSLGGLLTESMNIPYHR